MSTVTLFVSKNQKKNVNGFTSTLESLLKSLTDQKRVDVEESTSPDCSPAVILALRDFGGFGKEKMGEIELEVRKITRDHFKITDEQISVTITGTFVL